MPSSPDARRDLSVALRRSSDFVAQGEAEECILAPAAAAGSRPGGLALNRVGAWIWQRFDGRTSGLDIVEALMAEFDVERSRAERDYLALTDRLLELGAVVAVGSSEPGRAGEPDRGL